VSMSPDFNVGDLVMLQHSVFHAEYNGALAEIVTPEQWRGSLTPSCHRRPAQRLYRVRVIAPVVGAVSFLVARYQLRPLPGVAIERFQPEPHVVHQRPGERLPESDHRARRPGPRALAELPATS
jgi:hypothetical protein